MSATKPFAISKHVVMAAWQAVKANAGACGVDKQSIEDFDAKLRDNLYKLWNRMSSGTYFPPPVKAVAIPKKSGGERMLGIPTVADRVAQMVVKLTLEPSVEPAFLQDSYGYRPGKSALDAVRVTRERCWRYSWVVEFDIKGLFDNIDHVLLMRAVRKHTKCEWVILYIKRWLIAPLQKADGALVQRTKGTPQGGVASPILANLFLHYAFDVWMKGLYPNNPWCRYADDGLVHCTTEAQARLIRNALEQRFAECKLELHPIKTKIVYCKDSNRRGSYSNTKFDFLGYRFRARGAKRRNSGELFTSFLPAVSPIALKSMRQTTRSRNFRNKTDLSLDDISRMYNSVLRGWWQYYGRFYPTAMYPVFRHFNRTLVVWARRKYRRLRCHPIRASHFVRAVANRQPQMFVHWQLENLAWFA